MNKKILIVGAGGFGREICSYLLHDGFNVIGFIDDNPNALDGFSYTYPVVSSIQDFVPEENTHLVLAVADPQTRQKIYYCLKEKRASFLTFIHSSAFCGQNIEIGDASIITPSCILTSDISLGISVIINTNSTIGHDCTVGDFSTLNGKVEITGNNKIGGKCLFGVGALVIPNKIIEDEVVVGAGSVVIRRAKKGHTYFGNPSRAIAIPHEKIER